MPHDYSLPPDEVIDRLERIERRLDNMGQRIAYLEGNLGQRVAFLEGAVLGPMRDASVPSKMPCPQIFHPALSTVSSSKPGCRKEVGREICGRDRKGEEQLRGLCARPSRLRGRQRYR